MINNTEKVTCNVHFLLQKTRNPNKVFKIFVVPCVTIPSFYYTFASLEKFLRALGGRRFKFWYQEVYSRFMICIELFFWHFMFLAINPDHIGSDFGKFGPEIIDGPRETSIFSLMLFVVVLAKIRSSVKKNCFGFESEVVVFRHLSHVISCEFIL